MKKKEPGRTTKASADHVIARISGVKEGDPKVEAALKVIETMRLGGLPTKAAERMLARYRARTGE